MQFSWKQLYGKELVSPPPLPPKFYFTMRQAGCVLQSKKQKVCLRCGNKMPTRCNRGFYCRSYCLLKMFQEPLCPSSGAQEYYTVLAACGISCCGFQFVGLVWSWGLCVRFAGCCNILQTGHITLSPSQRLLRDNTQHSQQTSMLPVGFKPTINLSRRAAKNLCLRPRGHWDQHKNLVLYQNSSLTHKKDFPVPYI